MLISKDMLVSVVSLQEVEDDLASDWVPDLWLRQWRRLCDRLVAGDELWEIHGIEVDPPDWEHAPDFDHFHDGYALVRGGEILESIEVLWW